MNQVPRALKYWDMLSAGKKGFLWWYHWPYLQGALIPLRGTWSCAIWNGTRITCNCYVTAERGVELVQMKRTCYTNTWRYLFLTGHCGCNQNGAWFRWWDLFNIAQSRRCHKCEIGRFSCSNNKEWSQCEFCVLTFLQDGVMVSLSCCCSW